MRNKRKGRKKKDNIYMKKYTGEEKIIKTKKKRTHEEVNLILN